MLTSKQTKPAAEIALQGGKYRVEATLGRGEFGITYYGTDVQLGQKIAIKTLRPSLRHHTNFAHYYHHFQMVSRSLIQCRHPHLIRVLDVFEEKGLPFMVMQYLPGSSLGEKRKSSPSLKIQQGLDYINQIAAALKTIHQQGLLHCNLQPQNILLSAESQRLTLIDFGVNSSLIEQTVQPYRGNRNLPSGFAALEQYFPQKSLTPATDVYGLAALFYYLLTGQPPLEAPRLASKTTEAWFTQVQPSLKQSHPHLNSSIEQMILWGLAIHPADRPQTIDQWLALSPSQNFDNVTPHREVAPVGEHPAPSHSLTRHPTTSNPSFTSKVFSQGASWSIPLVFVATALIFGCLGFSLARRYTQTIVYKLNQKIQSEQTEVNWSEDTFSDYDPSKPMFEQPSVKTKVIEPDPWEEEDLALEDEDFDTYPLPSSQTEDFSQDELSRDLDRGWDDEPAEIAEEEQWDDDYDRPRLTPNYGSQTQAESDNFDDYSRPTYPDWTNSDNNTWETETVTPSTESYTQDYNNYNDENNDNNYNYGSDRYLTESDSTPSEYGEYNDVPRLEPTTSDNNWNSTSTEPIPSLEIDAAPDSSRWTPEPSIEPKSWQEPAPSYRSSPSVQLSIPPSTQAVSPFSTTVTLPTSSFNIEEMTIPTVVKSEVDD